MKDWVLEDLIKIAEDFQEYTTVTIQTEAYIITGTIVDTGKYYSGLKRFFPKEWRYYAEARGMEHTVKNMMKNFDRETYGDEFPFLYLNNVDIFFGKDHVIESEYWRISIDKITGFSLGELLTNNSPSSPH